MSFGILFIFLWNQTYFFQMEKVVLDSHFLLLMHKINKVKKYIYNCMHDFKLKKNTCDSTNRKWLGLAFEKKWRIHSFSLINYIYDSISAYQTFQFQL